MKKIAVLTSGGDAPGMNAAIRAAVRSAIYNNLEIYGIKYGYRGLIDSEIEKMNVYSVADIIHRGGTILYTAREKRMLAQSGIDKAAENLEKLGIEGLIVIGGDGSYKGALELSKLGIKVVTLPGTIDNDIPSTDYSIGFDTAINTAIEAISKIRDTSSSHNRVNVVEVMGRHSGNIALYSGLAGGAEGIVVPEMNYEIDAIVSKTIAGKDRGKLHSIIVFAEGAGDVVKFSEEFEKKAGVTVKRTTLGYIQRGGSPSAFDRILAAKMGSLAVKLLIDGKQNRTVCCQKNQFIDMDINDALSMEYKFDFDTYQTAMELSI